MCTGVLFYFVSANDLFICICAVTTTNKSTSKLQHSTSKFLFSASGIRFIGVRNYRNDFKSIKGPHMYSNMKLCVLKSFYCLNERYIFL